MSARATPVALTIAGSDSGGGAGIQADLKAFARTGVHGASALTAITAQSTVGVSDVHPVPPAMIVAQVRAVADDIGIDAVKVGMLGSVATIDAVTEALDLLGAVPVVVDPVMVAESGARLLAEDAVEALVRQVLPRATVVTPNVAEARVLAGAGAEAGQEELARAVLALGPDAAIVTGGHTASGEDLLVTAEAAAAIRFSGPRHPDGAAHGSGCTHSSALAGLLACGLGLEQAARRARELAAEAVGNGLRELGSGTGPVDVLGISGARG